MPRTSLTGFDDLFEGVEKLWVEVPATGRHVGGSRCADHPCCEFHQDAATKPRRGGILASAYAGCRASQSHRCLPRTGFAWRQITAFQHHVAYIRQGERCYARRYAAPPKPDRPPTSSVQYPFKRIITLVGRSGEVGSPTGQQQPAMAEARRHHRSLRSTRRLHSDLAVTVRRHCDRAGFAGVRRIRESHRWTPIC